MPDRSLIQCGSLDGTGSIGSRLQFRTDRERAGDGKYPAGTIAMARAGDNAYSQGHQFFIMYEDGTIPADSAGGYTVFGHVTSGLDDFVSDIAERLASCRGAPVATTMAILRYRRPSLPCAIAIG